MSRSTLLLPIIVSFYRRLTWMEVHVGAGAAIWTWILQPKETPWLSAAVGLGAMAFYQADHLWDAWRDRGIAERLERDRYYTRNRFTIGAVILVSLCITLAALLQVSSLAFWRSVIPAALGTVLYSIAVYGTRFRHTWIRATLIGWVFACSVCGIPEGEHTISLFSGTFLAAWVNVVAIRSGKNWLLTVFMVVHASIVMVLTDIQPEPSAIAVLGISQTIPALIWVAPGTRAAVADWLITTVGLLSLLVFNF